MACHYIAVTIFNSTEQSYIQVSSIFYTPPDVCIAILVLRHLLAVIIDNFSFAETETNGYDVCATLCQVYVMVSVVYVVIIVKIKMY